MKKRDERVERLERALIEAHQVRPEKEADEVWRRTLMADIRSTAAGPAREEASEVEAAFMSAAGRLAPALAAAAAVLFVVVWISFYGVYDEVAFAMVTDIPGSLELSAMGF